jgi:hypothetical protein
MRSEAGISRNLRLTLEIVGVATFVSRRWVTTKVLADSDTPSWEDIFQETTRIDTKQFFLVRSVTQELCDAA